MNENNENVETAPVVLPTPPPAPQFPIDRIELNDIPIPRFPPDRIEKGEKLADFIKSSK
ncbi:hypothetical protein [uncultured Mucilaginibacter sp.]|uniref:hypothetical protein n=1 Tax=uncultured Mucilaginibacter sp. TaxID=797541 RepID=UPI00263643EE|nr:hypothetical protein [uncultured Mucilaginibacter sp.]